MSQTRETSVGSTPEDNNIIPDDQRVELAPTNQNTSPNLGTTSSRDFEADPEVEADDPVTPEPSVPREDEVPDNPSW